MIRKAMSALKGTLEAKVTGEPTLGRATADSVELSVPVRISVAPERYQDWCDHYIPWFEKLADKHTSAPYSAGDMFEDMGPLGRRPLNDREKVPVLYERACASLGLQAPDRNTVPMDLGADPPLIVDSLDGTKFWVFHFDVEENDRPSRSPYSCYRPKERVLTPDWRQSGFRVSRGEALVAASLPVWKLSFLAGGDGAEEVRAAVVVGSSGLKSCRSSMCCGWELGRKIARHPGISVVWAAPFDSYRICPAVPFRGTTGSPGYVRFSGMFGGDSIADLVVSVDMPLDALERFEKCSVSLCWPEWD